ncbi:MAG: aminoacyl-tRNA hydrolase [Clostridia bacterium]|nr:aminoacyl-tRNA hydrolase [Oscillospiraceae bacterium]MBQ2746347.1 aminoacyl-tRNA hydrolase [Clostridia bacterium]
MFFKKKESDIILVAGLGNPGNEYENTRHNIGFDAADLLHKKFGGTPFKSKHKALISECKIANKRIFIVKPQTYMNLSGTAISEICRFYKIPIENIIVIFDDISLDVGKMRIRRGGSHGGHNGMKNISEHLSTNDIMRIKIGIGKKPHPDYDLKDWVLGKFSADDKENKEIALQKAVASVEEIISGNIDRAMNKYNS